MTYAKNEVFKNELARNLYQTFRKCLTIKYLRLGRSGARALSR